MPLFCKLSSVSHLLDFKESIEGLDMCDKTYQGSQLILASEQAAF